MRLLPPLMGASLALTLVFVAAWIDGDLQAREGRRERTPRRKLSLVAFF